MSEPDEYDVYFDPLTLNDEDLDAIEAAEARALAPDHPAEHTPEPHCHSAPLSRFPPSPDEFDAYDLTRFSPEDFEQIDKLALSVHPPPPPAILESSDRTSPTRRQSTRSPYEQFRSGSRVLSVTDITGPSWCEVRFDYGLRQQRHKKLADRPASFVTAEGKTINVALQVAAVNARITARGTSVHKVLEGRTQLEAVNLEIKSDEERWGLRLVKMLTSLHTLMGLGRCREMPVFGLINDQIVTGIIDEVVIQPLPASPTLTDLPLRGTTRSTNTAEPAIDVELEEPATPVPSQPEVPEVGHSSVLGTVRYSLHLSETKTRARLTIPPEEDAFAGRIQLMLYHRLLSNALSAAQPDIASSRPLDFDAFWRKAGVDPTRKFSDSFLLLPTARRAPRKGETLENPATYLSSINCLNDLTRAWHREVEALNAVRVDNTLTIVYRAQPTGAGQSAAPPTANVKGKERERENETGVASTPESTVSSTPSSLSEREARDIAAAIQASLRDVQPGAGGDEDLARAMSESLRDAIRPGHRSEKGGLGVVAGASAGWDTPARVRVAEDALESAEDTQLAWALQESLLARFKETLVLKEDISETVVSSGIDAPVAGVAEEASKEDNGQSGVAVGTPPSRAATEEPEGASKTAPSSLPAVWEEGDGDEDDAMITAVELETKANIIGMEEFALDDWLLDDYLKNVLAWWYGKRPPKGVDVVLTMRCVTCEYMDGCEWREKKASEALQKYQDRSIPGAAAEWM